MTQVLSAIPVTLGDAGSNLAGSSSGTPTLKDLLIEHRAALLELQGGGAGGGGEHAVAVAYLATTANIASLAAVSTTMDGGTITAGKRILVKDQTDHTQNGIYVAGTVVAGPVCPLTRATDMATASTVEIGQLVMVQAGSVGGGKQFAVTAGGVVGTSTIDFGVVTASALASATPTDLGSVGAATVGVGTTAARADHVHGTPSTQQGTLTLSSGTLNVTSAKITASSRIFFTRTTSAGTTLTTGYAVTAKTPGAAGASSFTVQAQVAAGTINTADGSTLDYAVVG